MPKHSHKNEEDLRNAFANDTIIDKSTGKHNHSISTSGLARVGKKRGDRAGKKFHYAEDVSSSNVSLKENSVQIVISKSDFKGKFNFKTSEDIYLKDEQVKPQEKYYQAYYSVIKIMKYKSN